MSKQRIGLIGAGRMATALAQGLLRAELVSAVDLLVADPSEDARGRFAEATGVEAVDDNLIVAASADVVVLAVKPQNIASVMAQLHDALDRSVLVVSIAAGIRLATLAAGLSDEVRLIRVMPNTPCLIGQGASGFSLGRGATDDDRDLVERMLGAMGLAVEVEERLLDAVTGLSGSGPAYVFTIIEALSEGGIRMGLPRDVALRLAAQTLRGAAEMVLTTGEPPSVLRDRVTSPGGTTIAGLQSLEAAGLQAALSDAVEAATLRSIELGSGSDPSSKKSNK